MVWQFRTWDETTQAFGLNDDVFPGRWWLESESAQNKKPLSRLRLSYSYTSSKVRFWNNALTVAPIQSCKDKNWRASNDHKAITLRYEETDRRCKKLSGNINEYGIWWWDRSGLSGTQTFSVDVVNLQCILSKLYDLRWYRWTIIYWKKNAPDSTKEARRTHIHLFSVSLSQSGQTRKQELKIFNELPTEVRQGQTSPLVSETLLNYRARTYHRATQMSLDDADQSRPRYEHSPGPCSETSIATNGPKYQ